MEADSWNSFFRSKGLTYKSLEIFINKVLAILLLRSIYRIKSTWKLRLNQLSWRFFGLMFSNKISYLHGNSVLLYIHIWWRYTLHKALKRIFIPLDIFFILHCLFFILRVDVITLRFRFVDAFISILMLRLGAFTHVLNFDNRLS